ncbi:MAG: DUF5011 domain-containing protein [Erysipelotrichaceae bacterium]|nr:DUF5011 domain-containing protein [Erysipelotrichaceae bacterium]
MKKKIILLLSIYFIILPVKALTYKEIESRSVCPNFELAIANTSKNLDSVACFDTYLDAKNKFNETNNDDLVILERKNNITKIIDAKYALVYLGVRSISENTNYYSNNNLTSSIAYMNHHPNYGATDGAFLEFNYDNHAALVYSNGVKGWLKNDYYRIIPLNFLGTTSYYKIVNNELYHYYGKDIQTNYSSYGRVIDKKPDYLENKTYYSFDGTYFYNSFKELITDLKNNNHNLSVNKDNPYYNYYMYLPHRGISNYSGVDIDSYLKNNKGLIGTIYGNKAITHYSNMYQTGNFFKNSEYLYGANAILMMSLATNESALGQSSIAIYKNNLFGHSAYDSSAFDSATGYLNPYQSIIGHAKSYINCGYANPNDSRYYGSNMGNKSSGMNIKYASDPYWGEKAANYYYLFDKDNGFLDYNYYQLGITTNYGFNVRSEPNQTSSIPFTIKSLNVPVIILEEVKGTYYNGSDIWYKVVSDMNLNGTRTSGVSCSYANYYNYNSYVYIHSSFIKKINKTINGKYNSVNLQNNNYIYKEYASGAKYTPKTGTIIKNTDMYITSSLNDKIGSLNKGMIVPVFMTAYLNDKPVAYLVESIYSKNQKAWIDASSLEFVNKDLLITNLNTNYLNVFNDVSGSVIGSIYTNTYSVIVDSKKSNNDLWIKIHYDNNTYAWLNTNISASLGTIFYTTDLINQPPTITATDKTIYVKDEFDPLKDVKAIDPEDGDITKNIKVSGSVDINKPGIYQLTYEVIDSKGEKATKTIKVVVKDYEVRNSLFMYESLKHVSSNTFEFKGFLGTIKEDNKNNYHTITFKNEDTNKEYTYKLDKYLDYPYEMSSLEDDKKYDYSAGWFQGKIDLSNLENGNYLIYINSYNYTKGTKTTSYFTNIAYLDMPRRVKGNNLGFAFNVDFSHQGSPMILEVRKDLISYDEPISMDPMYNYFNKLKLDGDNLTITGTSHSIGINYSKNDTVKREIIFENLDTYERTSYDLSYIDNGPYKIELAVSDNKDKTRAWFKKTISLKDLKKGKYSVIIKTTSNNKTYYGELMDVAYTDFSNLNTSNYIFSRIDEKRLRLELEKK